jgi:hypothetical protein
LESVKSDGAMKTLMPEGLPTSYISVKEKEVEVFEKMTGRQAASVLRVLLMLM